MSHLSLGLGQLLTFYPLLYQCHETALRVAWHSVQGLASVTSIHRNTILFCHNWFLHVCLWAPLAAHRSQMAAVPTPTAGSSSDHSIYAQPEFHFQRYHFSSLLHFGLFWPNFLYRSIIFVNCRIFCGARRQHNYMLCCVRTEWLMCSGQVPGMCVTYPVTWDWKASRWDSFRTQVLLENCSNWNLCTSQGLPFSQASQLTQSN